MSERIRFSEKPCIDGKHLTAPLQQTNRRTWEPVVSCPAQFPLELFETALMILINHPEYNSTIILRTEIISDEGAVHDETSDLIPTLVDYTPTRNIHRRLLPRRPNRDGSMEQDCTFYATSKSPSTPFPSVLVLTPRTPQNEPLPYYHPAVVHLAFRYVSVESGYGHDPNHLVIEIIPLDRNSTIDLPSRIYRTCLSLLEALDRYGWGIQHNYQKRVTHDVLVPRNTYQDLYLILKERHKTLVDQWCEVTDPLKHVFEDVGIATYLMLLWKHTYNAEDVPKSYQDSDSEPRPWDGWPRPPGGFVDIGCGNGLLTHILLSEGYAGEGFDLRARISWSQYPPETRKHLHVHALTPHHNLESDPHLHPSSFLIGNHADELTPWMPVLASLLPASGYLSIPCCQWDFDAKYERGVASAYPVPQFDSKSQEHAAFVDTLLLGAEGQRKSSYSMYRIWLAYLSKACGWKVECEVLRIPSTRNWAIVGRKRTAIHEGMKTSKSVLSVVEERGVFKTRKPEGKARH